MILRAKRREKAYITSYYANIGSREAREAGFLNPDGTSKVLKKTVDAKRHRIIIEIDEAAQQQQEC